MSLHAILIDLIHRFGPLGVALGAALEGEAAVVVGGALARHGAFSPWLGGIGAFVGSYATDQALFALGRNRRGLRLVHKFRGKPVFARAIGFIDRHPLPFCFAFRFIYGFRVAGPLAIGVSDVSARTFAIVNFASAAVWAAVFTLIGYRFEPTLARLIARVGHLDAGSITVAMLAVACVGGGALAYSRLRTRPVAPEL